jgi:hypothetical protein
MAVDPSGRSARVTPSQSFLAPQRGDTEYHGIIDDLAVAGKLADWQYRSGPVLIGLQNLAPYGKLKYQIGYQFALTQATERGAVRWRFQYEIPF